MEQVLALPGHDLSVHEPADWLCRRLARLLRIGKHQPAQPGHTISYAPDNKTGDAGRHYNDYHYIAVADALSISMLWSD